MTFYTLIGLISLVKRFPFSAWSGKRQFPLCWGSAALRLGRFHGLPSRASTSVFGPQQNNMVPSVVGADANDFPAIVDRHCLNQLPAAVWFEEFVQVV